MTDTNKQIDKILDEWLVHTEDCAASLYDGTCNCIQLNVKQNLKTKLHDLMVRERISELKMLPLDDAATNQHFVSMTIGERDDRIKSLGATLNTKENTE